MKVYYLTRSYFPSRTGGTIVRKMQVDGLAKHFDVVVVTPEPKSMGKTTLEVSNPSNIKVGMIYQRLGIYEDYLDPWVKKAFDQLREIVNEDDVVFATSGGELGCLKLGSLLKKALGCKLVLNLHDPINYTYVHGVKRDKKFHVSREGSERRLLSLCDKIVTSADSNRQSLIKKYPELKDKITNSYFGYHRQKIVPSSKLGNDKIRIIYAGNMGVLQKPELLYEAWSRLPEQDRNEIEILYVGDYEQNATIKNLSGVFGVTLISSLSQGELFKLYSEVDIGFVSLVGDYFAACFPSKIFDYIAAGLPILGLLPEGDAYNVINEKFGRSFLYQDIYGLSEYLSLLANNKSDIAKNRKNILQYQDEWSSQKHIELLIGVIKSSLN